MAKSPSYASVCPASCIMSEHYEFDSSISEPGVHSLARISHAKQSRLNSTLRCRVTAWVPGQVLEVEAGQWPYQHLWVIKRGLDGDTLRI